MRTELKIGFVAALVVAAGAIYFVVNQGPESGGDMADTLPLDAPAKDVAPAGKRGTPSTKTPAVTRDGQPALVVRPGRSPGVATPGSNTGTRTTKPPVTKPPVTRPKVTVPPAGGRQATVAPPAGRQPATRPATVPPSGPAVRPATSQPAAKPSLAGDPARRGPGVSPPTPRDTTRRTLPPPAVDVQRHTIVEGESLWAIAAEYYENGALWPRIKEANPGLDEARLEVGRSIVIPPKEGAVARPTATTPTTSSAARRHVYVVEIGDTLTSIARGVLGDPNRWREIYELNRDQLSSPDIVPVGFELKLPAR